MCVHLKYIPRASRFISDIGISIIPEYAFMNISATATARIFRVLTAYKRVRAPRDTLRYKSYFIIFLRREPESTREGARVENRVYCATTQAREKERSSLRLNEQQQQQQQRLFLVFHFSHSHPSLLAFHGEGLSCGEIAYSLVTKENAKGTFHATAASCNATLTAIFHGELLIARRPSSRYPVIEARAKWVKR